MDLRVLTRVLRKRRALRRHDRWSRAELEAYQAASLRALRDFAVGRSAFYRRFHRGLERRGLHELPVLTKPRLMEAFDELVTRPGIHLADVARHVDEAPLGHRFQDEYWTAATSGTTGARGVFLWDLEEWTSVLASYARANDWAGLHVGLTRRMKLAVVSSRLPWHQSAVVGATLDSRIVPTLRLDARDPLRDTVEQLNGFQPDNLTGYASMLRQLAEEQLAGRLRIHPKVVMSASEVLSPAARRRIALAWGGGPFDVYAATETAGIASECEEHRLHLYEDLVIAEAVDERDRPVPAGVPAARLLVTVLFSRTLPLIRYAMSDSVILASSDACPCGRPFALLAGVEGRREDVLDLPGRDGGVVPVHPNVFHEVLDPAPVQGWQVVQEGDGLRLLLVGALAADASALAGAVVTALERQGVTVPVRAVPVAEIPRSRAGKTPWVLRRST